MREGWLIPLKKYYRSAAAKKNDPAYVRPERVLLACADYLLRHVSRMDHAPEWEKYVFIVDRLRAVRMDIGIQRLRSVAVLRLLDASIRYHFQAFETMAGADLTQFDPHMNKNLIKDCYDRFNSVYRAASRREHTAEMRKMFWDLRALKVLFSLEEPYHLSMESRQYGLRGPLSDRMREALALRRLFRAGHYVGFFRRARALDFTGHCAIKEYIPALRVRALERMNGAYRPEEMAVRELAGLLGYTSEDSDDAERAAGERRLVALLRRMGFSFGAEGAVKWRSKLRPVDAAVLAAMTKEGEPALRAGVT